MRPTKLLWVILVLGCYCPCREFLSISQSRFGRVLTVSILVCGVWPFNRASTLKHILLPMATLHLVSPSTSGFSDCCPFEDLPFYYLKLLHSPVCPVCSITLHLCPWGLFCRNPLLSKSGSSGPSLWQLIAVVSPDSPCGCVQLCFQISWAWGFFRLADLLVDGHLLALY